MAPFVMMTSKRVTPFVFMACFCLAFVDKSYCSDEVDSNLLQNRQMVETGQILRGSTLDLNPNFKASSRYSISYLAAKAATGGYWCSKKGAAQPAYWWIYFEQEQVEIVEIRFHEVYAGATFEFFASNAKECSNTYTGRKLINGTRDEINGKIFVNGKRYHCYGLKITNLPTTTKWGKIATLQNFEFFVHYALIVPTICVSTTSLPTDSSTPYVHTKNRIWRDDLYCGEKYKLPNGQSAQCDAESDYPCCASHGICGYKWEDCHCDECIDFREAKAQYMLKSSSIFGKSYLPEKALLPSNMYYQGYFCSKKNVAPVHWWMEFQEPIAVTSIIFHEKYKGCIYEFWGCNGTVNINDSYKCTGEKKIFSCGTQKALLSSSSSDNALYYVYGLTAIELGNNGYMGISGFKFGTNECKDQTCSGRGSCINVDYDYSCECNPGFSGKDCEMEVSSVPIEIGASSVANSRFAPKKALDRGLGYGRLESHYSSKRNDNGNLAPVHWWIRFQEPILIGAISFKQYRWHESRLPDDNKYEFWGCNGTINEDYECTGKKVILMTGDHPELMTVSLLGKDRYYVYGLTATKLEKYGYLSINSFRYGENGCELRKCYERGSCIVLGDNSYACNCDGRFTGKDCETAVCDDTWKARDGKTCSDYRENKYCKVNGDHYGYGWNKKAWGNFERWSDALGRSAVVCPLCGCGGDPNAKEEISTYVRLLKNGEAEKRNRNEGRLEVWSNGKWNSICDRDVTKYGDLALAKVVCHMLGEKVGAKVMGPNIGSFHYHNAYPPEESDVDYLCKGNETSIFDCETQPRNKKCHMWWDDVAIKCSPFTNP